MRVRARMKVRARSKVRVRVGFEFGSTFELFPLIFLFFEFVTFIKPTCFRTMTFPRTQDKDKIG